MAKVWPAYEGLESKLGKPWAEVPLAEAISMFDLTQDGFLSDLSKTPMPENRDPNRWFPGYKHIVVQIESAEGRRQKWRPGYYLSRVRPDQAARNLMQRALAAELGAENVVDVKFGPTTDSEGNDALKVTVVIAPDTAEKLVQDRSGATLAALVRLQQQLTEMGEVRTPIVEYATEAELAEDAST